MSNSAQQHFPSCLARSCSLATQTHKFQNRRKRTKLLGQVSLCQFTAPFTSPNGRINNSHSLDCSLCVRARYSRNGGKRKKVVCKKLPNLNWLPRPSCDECFFVIFFSPSVAIGQLDSIDCAHSCQPHTRSALSLLIANLSGCSEGLF